MRVLFSLDSDASDSGLGALLSQVQSGKERLIAYVARALSKAERNSTSRHTSILRWNIVRDSCIAMQMDCHIFPGTRMHQLRTGDMPP